MPPRMIVDVLRMDIYAFIFIAFISIFAVILTVYDKHAAKKNKRRVSEITLLFICLLGGSVAMFVTMLSIRHKTLHARFMLGIPLIIALQIVTIIFAFDDRISVNYIDVKTEKINGEISLVLITDLHSCDYGDGQIELIKAIDSVQPDVVMLSGDIFDDDMPLENATEFIQTVSLKYPCYYVSGNHEIWSGNPDGIKNILRRYNVTVLEGTSEILTVGDNRVIIGGIDDPKIGLKQYNEQLERLKEDLNEHDLYTIMLSHRPELIDEFLPLKPDIVLSGHAHGGQWRLPFVLENGLYAPNQGVFPKYTNGEYIFGDTTLIVSRGLARESTRAVPRIFNRPEIVVVTIKNGG